MAPRTMAPQYSTVQCPTVQRPYCTLAPKYSGPTVQWPHRTVASQSSGPLVQYSAVPHCTAATLTPHFSGPTVH